MYGFLCGGMGGRIRTLDDLDKDEHLAGIADTSQGLYLNIGPPIR